MGDFSISLIPTVSVYPNRETGAAAIHSWLVSEAIIEGEVSNCILGSGLGYSIGKQAQKAVTTPAFLPIGVAIDGLEIVTERTVFSTELDELICPNCKNDIVSDDWDLMPWLAQKSIGLICPQCAQESDIYQYTFKPCWGFSNLGFRFWNWPALTPQFIEQFEKRLGCTVSVVYERF